ncbi:O-antigen ligase family protein [Marinobacter sp. 1-4A]|uniref:O-antigen ligase family protein n=1 Tax=Marinobacter sp. 1-4A TaxID=2582919 RepID=UPI00190528C1|nr:O-antigen ligase family protein [Marinobacter sp. 1-4A]MBK1849822.1 O-antigen ligase family protein [Marinobacter sp. 1-4A]
MSKFALLFLVVFFGCIVAALFYTGAAAFILYQIVYFLNPDDRWWSANIPGLRYSFIASILMVFVLLLKYKNLSKISPWKQQPVFIYLIVLVFFFYLAKLWALAPSVHDKFTFIYLKLVVIILVAYKLLNSEVALKISLWAYILGCAYIGQLATSMGRNSGDRLEGIALPDGSDSNGVSAALVPAGAILLYYAWMGNKKVRFLCFFCGALIANALVLFNSRGAFLGTIASSGMFLLYMMFSKYRQKGQRGLAVLIVMVGLAGGLYVTDDLFWQRMSSLQSSDSGERGSHRVLFWMTTFEMMDDYPLGMGVYGYNLLSPSYLTETEREGVPFKTVHSIWFQALSEIGWHGLIVFLVMLGSLYRMSQKAKRFVLGRKDYEKYFHILALECSILGYLVTSTFINQFRAEILYWTILFLAVAIKVYYLHPLSTIVPTRNASTHKQERAERT